jgi:CRISPR-associated protein Cas5h
MNEIKKILVFDISADYAQFKKYFTNMSPLTFSIPPRTVISGIIGAIIGLDKEGNPENFLEENSFIALKINKPVHKVKLPTNYLKTVSIKHFSKFKEHKPTNVEYLKTPSFRIYFSHNDGNIYEKLKNNLEEHKSFYTLNLGISSCLANFAFIGEFCTIQKNKQLCEISSVIPVQDINNIVFEDDIMIQQCTLPNIMLNDREITEYKEFLYEATGKKLSIELEKYYHIEHLRENIIGM